VRFEYDARARSQSSPTILAAVRDTKLGTRTSIRCRRRHCGFCCRMDRPVEGHQRRERDADDVFISVTIEEKQALIGTAA